MIGVGGWGSGGTGLGLFPTPRTPRNPKLDRTKTVGFLIFKLLPMYYHQLEIQLNLISVVTCGFPPRPKNGSFIGNETTFQSSLRFECDEGFDLEGSETRMCTSDKNWSGKEVTCIGK